MALVYKNEQVKSNVLIIISPPYEGGADAKGAREVVLDLKPPLRFRLKASENTSPY